MTVCWRCGVDFDSTAFRFGAPCSDCQLDMPDEHWHNIWTRANAKPGEEVYELRAADIKRLHKRLLTDPEIADSLGISAKTALRWRQKLGLAANTRSGFEFIKDKEANRAQARINGMQPKRRKKHENGNYPRTTREW